LFVIVDEIIRKMKSAGRGCRMGDKQVKIVCYANDAVIISEAEDNLQRLPHRFGLMAEEYNMSLSVPPRNRSAAN